MVVLGLAYTLFRRIPKGAERGLYGGKGIIYGEKVTFSNKKTKKIWRPNIQKKKYFSQILDTMVNIKLTTAAMRCIDKAGGFDSYIYHTPEKKLQSKLGMALKQRMRDVVQKFDLARPDKVVRMPRRARYLDNLEQAETKETATNQPV